MPVRTYAAAIAAAAMLTAQPCLAADDFRDRRAPETRTGGFAGLSLRVPLDDDGRARRPTARLQFTTMTSSRDAAGSLTTRFAPGVELGAESRRAALSIGGQNVRRMDDRLGVGGSTGTTLAIVGGVVLVVFVLAAVASGTPTAGPPEGAFD